MKFPFFIYSVLSSTLYRPYDIIIGENIKINTCNISCVIKSSNVGIDVDKKMPMININDSEKKKNLKTIQNILDLFVEIGLSRNDKIIVAGGGVLGDMCGFASSIYMRGIQYENIPTTLLSMVDSSIGGKNGVNHLKGKNYIGTFYNPSKVIIDIQYLRTLNKRQYVSGIAEIIKYALISDESFFIYLE
jgi:3-dehydroquinate synthase